MKECVCISTLLVFCVRGWILIGSNTRRPRARVVIGRLQMRRRGSAGYGEREDRECQRWRNWLRERPRPRSRMKFSVGTLAGRGSLGGKGLWVCVLFRLQRLKLGSLAIALATRR
jgi:hypothetical protein